MFTRISLASTRFACTFGFMPNSQLPEEKLSAAVARRLRGRMGELQLKGTDIASAIGMTQGSFSRRYTGSAAWELDELEQLQKATGISIAYLLGLEDPAGDPALFTGSIVRIETPERDQQQQQQQQQGNRAEYVMLHPGFDRALFTGPIARTA